MNTWTCTSSNGASKGGGTFVETPQYAGVEDGTPAATSWHATAPNSSQHRMKVDSNVPFYSKKN
jgi:hypothetical protein